MSKKEKEGRNGYARVSIPIELIKYIDMIIKSKKYGYRSRAEFICEAIRIRLRELGYL